MRVEKLGFAVPVFDFRVPGVTSISVRSTVSLAVCLIPPVVENNKVSLSPVLCLSTILYPTVCLDQVFLC